MNSASFGKTKLILGAALILGSVVRFAPTLMAGFPINDGGMFLSMIRDLRLSGYLLPLSTSYNFSNIPFEYPPFGFYLARLLVDGGFDDIFVLRFLPALASSLAILGMYLLASGLLNSPKRGALAALIYALAPRSFTWLVMGGGLTRSLGFCFMLFMGWAVYQLFQDGARKWLGWATLFAALTVLSHPEAAIHAFALGVLLWLFYGRTVRATFQALTVGVGALLSTAPWWVTLLHQHGFAPIYSVLNTGMHGASAIDIFVRVMFPNDSVLPILSVFLVFGLLWGIWKRQYFLGAWTICLMLVEPRSALNVIMFPMSILLALWLDDLGTWIDARSLVKRLDLIFISLVLYLFAEGYLFSYRLAAVSLTEADRTAMTWVREHTPIESRFVILTGVSSPELDAFQEWFPALAERRSLTTFQGTEWTLGPQFFVNFKELISLQACKNTECLQAWLTKNRLPFDYVVVTDATFLVLLQV